MPTDPLTAARIPASSAAPNVTQDIQNAVNDLSSTTIPRFASTAARDAAYAAWVAAGHTMVNGLFCTVAGAMQEYRGSWKPVPETLFRRIASTATGTLNGSVNLQAAQTIPASPFGTSVPYLLDLTAVARVFVPTGLGAKLELFYDGATLIGGTNMTNGGTSTCEVTLVAKDTATIADNSSHTITAVLTSLGGTITVTTMYGYLGILARPYIVF